MLHRSCRCSSAPPGRPAFRRSPCPARPSKFARAAFSTLWSSVVQPLSGPPGADAHRDRCVRARRSGESRGRWNDRGLARRTTGGALVLLTVSLLPLALTRQSLWALAIGSVLLDFAVQAVHVTNQSLIYAVHPDAGSRIIGGYMVFYSVGSALGSSTAYAAAGWTGVSVLGAVFSCSALLLWATTRRPAQWRDACSGSTPAPRARGSPCHPSRRRDRPEAPWVGRPLLAALLGAEERDERARRPVIEGKLVGVTDGLEHPDPPGDGVVSLLARLRAPV